METIISGRRSRFISSRTAPGVVVDTWEDLEVARDDWQRTGVVLTFRIGHDVVDIDTGTRNPHVPTDGPVFAMGYDDDPEPDPVARFQEAYRQERERAAERLGGPIQFEQAWPTDR